MESIQTEKPESVILEGGISEKFDILFTKDAKNLRIVSDNGLSVTLGKNGLDLSTVKDLGFEVDGKRYHYRLVE